MNNATDDLAEASRIDPNDLSDEALYDLLRKRFDAAAELSIERRLEITQEALLLIVKRGSYNY